MKHSLLTIFMAFLTLSVSAAKADSLKNEKVTETRDSISIKAKADTAYAHDEYEEAVKLYSQLAKQGQNAAVCYNLGNSYYRLDDMAHAVLWYERAYLLNPGDGDIRFNLDMARSKTIDKVVPQHEIFFVSWFKALVNLMSVNAWAYLSIALFVLCLIALAVYIFGEAIWLRKAAFTFSVVMLICCLLGNICAWSQRQRLENRTGAIVMSSAVTVKSTPAASGNDLFILHEGTRVEIIDDTLTDWVEVELADGKIGWLPRKMIEVI